MKKNKMMRLASFLLVAVLLSTCAISGTFAKYVSTKEQTDTARVAKWSFKVGANDIATTDFVFDLFNTAYIADTKDADSDDLNDENVLDGTGTDAIIAPGTWGYFDLTLENLSEVDASYIVDFTVANTKNIPVKFYVAESDGNVAPAAPTALPSETFGTLEDINAAFDYVGGAKTAKNYRIYWTWAINGDDVIDTDLGVNGATITVTATITATQVD